MSFATFVVRMPGRHSMADVFISYANEDRDTARKLAAALEARGSSVWWDRKIQAGQVSIK